MKESKDIISSIENLSIPVTIIRFDTSKQDSTNYLFTIFHRLNTGGQKLNNQEIRNCIYSSEFNNLLGKIAGSSEWRMAMGKTPKINRLDNEELILRFFAFNDNIDNYASNLSKFLNNYLYDKIKISSEELKDKEEILLSTLVLIQEKTPELKEIYKLGRTVKESLLLGIYKNASYISSLSKEEFQKLLKSFLADKEFSKESLTGGLAKKEKVQSRISKSIRIFSGE